MDSDTLGNLVDMLWSLFPLVSAVKILSVFSLVSSKK